MSEDAGPTNARNCHCSRWSPLSWKLQTLDGGAPRFFDLPGRVYEGRFDDGTVEDLALITLDGCLTRVHTGGQERHPAWW